MMDNDEDIWNLLNQRDQDGALPIQTGLGNGQRLNDWERQEGVTPPVPPRPGTQWMWDAERGRWVETVPGTYPQNNAPRGMVADSTTTTPPPGPVLSNTDGPTSSGPGVESDFGFVRNPNEGFQWPTLSLPRASFRDFGGFKPFVQPTQDEILNDPVLQAQLKEGNNRIKQDRAFRGILNTGDTLKDIFDWTSDRIKLGGHDAFDRAFKVYDVNERQNPFNTWSANKDKYFQEFNTNLPSIQNEFLYNQYNPAKALWDQNYNQWKSTGDWLSNMSRPVD